ncbi:MAG: prephenate dehydrogenase [Methanobacterium sp. PtaU1.Bin242]|nr:MAG: prephenate dehydrogenase [Methanobacterium sp. PtaU1.Bin242]
MIQREDEDAFVEAMSSAAKHLDDLEAALGRSDKAISALTEEINILKKSLGKEVGLRHIYSGKVHVGILEDLSADFVTLKKDKKEIRLKISNVEILNPYQLIKWKNNNYPQKSYDVSVIFPDYSDPEIICASIKSLDGVVEARIRDLYHGSQIESGKVSITLSYKVIYPEIRNDVEKLLEGFGGVIR